MHISMGEWKMAMSLRDFELGMARSQRVIDEYRATRADVIRLRA